MSTSSTAATASPRIKTLLSPEQLQERIRQLGAEITRDYEESELVLACVLKGSFLFAADLARAIPNHALQVDFLGLASYGEATRSSGVVQITGDLTKPIAGKHVLIVEDIVDTGLTMRYLLDNLATRRPTSVKLCTLLYKPSRARTRIPIDYLGFQIEDRFVVGYGLDAADKYRNLPFIGVLRNG